MLRSSSWTMSGLCGMLPHLYFQTLHIKTAHFISAKQSGANCRTSDLSHNETMTASRMWLTNSWPSPSCPASIHEGSSRTSRAKHHRAPVRTCSATSTQPGSSLIDHPGTGCVWTSRKDQQWCCGLASMPQYYSRNNLSLILCLTFPTPQGVQDRATPGETGERWQIGRVPVHCLPWSAGQNIPAVGQIWA